MQLVWFGHQESIQTTKWKQSIAFTFSLLSDSTPMMVLLTWFSLKGILSQRRLISKALDGAGVGGLGELKATTAKEFNG